jgi:hypothetical protein
MKLPATATCGLCENLRVDVAHIQCLRCGRQEVHPADRAPKLCVPCYRGLKSAARPIQRAVNPNQQEP